jgi:UDP-N-acetylmuramoyl-tripeptide--D-alanyl-D-alanine ligase
MKRLSVYEIAEACKGRLVNPVNVSASSVCTDSRKIEPGAVFFALRGPNFDGHAFAEASFEKGAVCAVVESEIHTGFPHIVVGNTQRALLDLAAYYRRLFPGVTVIGITGSAGKTTTKDLTASVMSQGFKTKKTDGNFNNHIGVPLTLFGLDEGDEVIVVEMGMNHAGEIRELSLAAAPDIAVITNIGDSHIENFENREGIFRAKMEITDGLKANGVLIVNGDDPLLNKNDRHKTILCHIDKTSVVPLGLDGVRYHYKGQGINIPLPGEHMISNTLLAAAVGETMGLTLRQIAKGIESFTPSPDRMSFIQANGMQIINDSYNANPASMKAAISVLKDIKGRRVCILGDMFELGRHAEPLHREVGVYAALQGVNLITIGPLAKHAADGYETAGNYKAVRFPDKSSFLLAWRDMLEPGDTVLLKASNGMAFNEVLEGLIK